MDNKGGGKENNTLKTIFIPSDTLSYSVIFYAFNEFKNSKTFSGCTIEKYVISLKLLFFMVYL